MASKPEIFFCYAHEDEPLLQKLKTELKPLQRQGLIQGWQDRDISAGTEWAMEIDKRLNTAEIILLLISADFMDSDYCYGIEMKRAIERHNRKESHVIPVILRPVYWDKAPFGKLQALPTDSKPITSSSWHNMDEAFVDVVEGIRKAIDELRANPSIISRDKTEVNSLKQVEPQPPSFNKQVVFSLIQTLLGHLEDVSSIAISPDGHTLVSASWDKTIKIWNLHTGELLRTLAGHTSNVNSVAISPDGHTLVSGSDDNTIKVWNLNTGQQVRTLTGHLEDVSSVAISPDEHTLVSASWDKMIKIWNLHTGELLRTLAGHTRYVFGVAISPYKKILASGSNDKTIMLWDRHKGTLLHTLTGHSETIYSVAISPNGKTLVSGSGDNTIKVWDLSTGELLDTLLGHSDEVRSLAFSPDGHTLVSGSGDNTIKVWKKK